MEKDRVFGLPDEQNQSVERSTKETIPVIHEHAVVEKEIVETGKVRIRKTVTEETAVVNLPIINESYDIEHVPISSKVLDTPPPAIRYEGNKTIITVLKEITVVQKKYEVIEEIHLTRRVTESPLVQEITLLKEHVHVERSGNNSTD
ncbi:MAG TPA: DUF2382 domain-containing protein [Chitinophagaceae bacterium]|jgi:stress response protein YsnF|nr:DUF2382 domain-containing protein [Chitinophagaceae bacterium]